MTGEPPVPFAARVAMVRAALLESASRAGLDRDPYGRVIEAQSAALEVFPAFLEEVQRARAPWTQDERRAAVAEAAARMDARLLHRMIQFNRWAVAAAALLGMITAGGAWSGGYWRGYRAAEDQLAGVPAALGGAMTGRDAAVWAGLIRHNDMERVKRTCGEQNGRAFCSFALWTGPAPPRPGPDAR